MFHLIYLAVSCRAYLIIGVFVTFIFKANYFMLQLYISFVYNFSLAL